MDNVALCIFLTMIAVNEPFCKAKNCYICLKKSPVIGMVIVIVIVTLGFARKKIFMTSTANACDRIHVFHASMISDYTTTTITMMHAHTHSSSTVHNNSDKGRHLQSVGVYCSSVIVI